MEFLLYLLVIIFVAYLVFMIYELFFKERALLRAGLEDIKDLYFDPNEENILRLPFTERVIRPLYMRLVGAIGRLTPSEIINEMERNISYAGSPANMTANRMITTQIMTAIVLPAFFYLLGNLSGGFNPLLIFLAVPMGFYLPVYVIKVQGRKRQTDIVRVLPDLLDLLYVSVEAGLGFDMALKRTTEKMPGPLSEEFIRALDDINKGRPREEALRAIANRTGVEDLSSFISAVIQSEQLGANIANMLRIQSRTMRERRRQRAEEAAAKVPIKMLMPLVFFMLPALFIVILGPAMIRIMQVFAEMF